MVKSFEIPDEIYTKLLEKYRPSTIRTLTLNLKRVLRDGFEIEVYDIGSLVDMDEVRGYLNSVKNSGMRKTLLSSVIAFLRVSNGIPKGLVEEYERYFNDLGKKVNNERLYKKPSLEELENWMPWKDIVKKRKKYRVVAETIEEMRPEDVTLDDKYFYMKYLLLCLYTYIHPLRGEEYLNSIVVSVSNEGLYETIRNITGRNLFDLKNKKFVVYGYKTSGMYGTRTIDIPDEVIDVVKKWVRISGTQLLLGVLPENEVPMLQESLTQMFFRIFEPKKISTSMLRKIYISHRLKTLKDVDKRKELALIMGHSLQTQEFIYKRFENDHLAE